ncbi:MAG: YggS family pyridoxal phosphate-dependent enzyme [Candidatus Omnitrophica bacterium]|nr:YggS family pyridoxal phosphate-dependent enzyme [Candidatus Omnitrophota bacterium]
MAGADAGMVREAVRLRLADVERRVCAAAQRSRRRREEIAVVCVTKQAAIEQVCAAVHCGVTELGENRVQEALRKYQQLQAALSPVQFQRLRWHLIGHLQTNKAAKVLPWVHLIQSVDSIPLAACLQARAAGSGRPVDVLIQVNISEETQKFGIAAASAGALISALRAYPLVRLRGLMGMAPQVEDPEAARPYFRRLRRLFDRINDEFAATGRQPLAVLSMGMSHDFETAIEEGATLVRVGTAIFGGSQ